ncbi:Nucleic acid-binding, OB-fold [Sesbania bispinosa]|nr:Nucleic acid-binding, OB-fold [Sesbania bispinosa]
MANRTINFDKVMNVSPVADSWIIKVLLSRMWCVHDEFGNKDCIAVDMLLIDSDGCKIQAKVYKLLFTNFISDMVEGAVYILRNFNVVPNVGSNKATNHPFTIVFQRRTVVTRTELDVVHTIGLSPLPANAIRQRQFSEEFLLDIVGLLTGVSTEKEYVVTGVVHRFITLELTDHTGKVEIALFDDYVDKLIERLSDSAHLRPVVVVQLAAAEPVHGVVFGNAILRNYLAATRVLVSPEMTEVVEFRKKIALHGLSNGGEVACLPGQVRYVSVKDDFINTNPPRKIVELAKNEQV